MFLNFNSNWKIISYYQIFKRQMDKTDHGSSIVALMEKKSLIVGWLSKIMQFSLEV